MVLQILGLKLNYGGATKLETTSTGVSVTGNINLGDNNKILLGDGDDVEMYWNGSTFVIETENVLNGTSITTNQLLAGSGTHLYINFNQAIQRFYSLGNERLQVNQTGVTVSGDLTVDLNTLFVDASANSVGINLTNPSDYTADELVISVPDGSGMTLVSGTTDAAYIEFKDSTGAIGTNGGFVSYDHDTDTLQNFAQSKVSIAILEAEVAYFTDTAFYVDKSTTIDDNLFVNENVGIGTTSPNTPAGNKSLHIAGTTGAELILERDDSGVAADDFIGGLAFLNSDGSNTPPHYLGITARATNEFGASQLEFFSSFEQYPSGTPDMVLDTSGNVGIGIDTPQTLLNVNSLSGTTYPTLGTASGVIAISINELHGMYLGVDGASGNGWIQAMREDATATAYNLILQPSGGSVGIGTTSPSDKLSVYTTTDYGNDSEYANATIGLGNQTYPVSIRSYRYGGSYLNGLDFYYNDGTQKLGMRINSSGNVGIGTDSPDASLQVNGATNFGNGAKPANTSNYINNFNNDLALLIKKISTGVGDYLSIQDSAGSSKFIVKSSGNVGINYTGPFNQISGTETTLAISNGNVATLYLNNTSTNGHNHIITSGTDGALGFYDKTAAASRMVIDSSGNVGIGTTTPTHAKLVLSSLQSNSSDYTWLLFDNKGAGYGDWSVHKSGNNNLAFGYGTSNGASYTDALTLEYGGSIHHNYISGLAGTSPYGFTIAKQTGYTQIYFRADTTSTRYVQRFYNDNSGTLQNVGNIIISGSTTSYATSSDYRLKENVVEMTGALDRVSQLKPSRFNFIADADTTVDGFLAHEVQEIVPEAITGEKDAMKDEEYEISPDVYEDVVHPAVEAVYETVEHPAVEEELDDEGNVVVEGKEAYTEEVLVTEAKEEWTEKVLVTEKVMGTREVPDYQGIDQSKLVPLLVGAIQELKAEIESLKLQINN